MLKTIKTNWPLILIELMILVVFFIFKNHYGDVIVDSFREVYLPKQILEGKVLYKNIFCIYPPLAYLFNSFLYKIFGVNLNILLYSGLVFTMGIFYFVNKISKIFLNDFLTIVVCLFTFSGLVLSPNVFNPFLPYSYGILYGLFFVLGSVYFALEERFPISCLLCSLAICSKYEFVLFLPILILLSYKKNIFKNILCFLAPIVITLGILFLQGLTFDDLKTSIELIGIISSTKTLHWFYSSMGLFFRWELIPIYIINFIKFLFPINWNLYQEVLIWIFPFIAILTAIRYRLLDKNEKVFIIASLLISAKVIFALTLQSYGVFFIPFALIAFLILIPKRFIKYVGILILIWSVIVGAKNVQTLSAKNVEISSQYGKVYTTSYYANGINEVLKYIKTSPKSSKVVVYPECLAINFLSDRQSDDKFYSLIPLYVETFGEENIITRLEKYPPEYIIINNYNTSAYYFSEIGKDYGADVYNWISNNYRLDKAVGSPLTFEIFTKN